MPRDLDFPGRQAGEHVVIVLHRHGFIFVRSAFTLFISAAAPVLAWFIWSQVTTQQVLAGTLMHTALVMALVLYYLFLWNLIYGFWLDYYLDTFILTNKRVIDISQAGLFSRGVKWKIRSAI